MKKAITKTRPKYKRWTLAEIYASAKGLEYGIKEYEEFISAYNDAPNNDKKGK